MDVVARWPHLQDLLSTAAAFRGVETWLFGSARSSPAPADIDLLLIYIDRSDAAAIRDAQWWSDCAPPIHIIAMTVEEEQYYDFIAVTGAIRIG